MSAIVGSPERIHRETSGHRKPRLPAKASRYAPRGFHETGCSCGHRPGSLDLPSESPLVRRFGRAPDGPSRFRRASSGCTGRGGPAIRPATPRHIRPGMEAHRESRRHGRHDVSPDVPAVGWRLAARHLPESIDGRVALSTHGWADHGVRNPPGRDVPPGEDPWGHVRVPG